MSRYRNISSLLLPLLSFSFCGARGNARIAAQPDRGKRTSNFSRSCSVLAPLAFFARLVIRFAIICPLLFRKWARLRALSNSHRTLFLGFPRPKGIRPTTTAQQCTVFSRKLSRASRVTRCITKHPVNVINSRTPRSAHHR